LAERYPEPTLRWFAIIFTGALGLFRGEVETAERLANDAFALGAESGQPDAALWYGGQLGAVRIQQGRSSELLPMLRMLAGDNVGNQSIHATLAFCLTEVGELGEAADLLQEVHRSGYSGIPYSGGWLQSLGLCGLVAAEVGDLEAGNAVASMLAPFEDQVMVGGASISGPVAAPLARLALLRGDLDESERLFSSSYETTVRLESPYFLAGTAERWAELAGRRGDVGAQRALLDEARTTARQHGFGTVEARCSRVLDSVGGP
jgi:hypothetical protein